MCGICGWLSTDKKIDYSVLEKMNNIVAYRGPDDEGYAVVSKNGISHFSGQDSCITKELLTKEVQSEDVFFALAHRRLSILDLSNAGHQPMQSKNGRLCITYNGEIYNYLEIRDELKKEGYEFETNCDTEVLLMAYMKWGEACVEHFNGMWAFAIWDADEKKIFCSRDRMGAKPFYYYYDGRNFIFSSEIKQICQNNIVPRIIDEKVLVRQITWKLTDYSEETLIRDIKTLRGGHNLTFFLNDNYDNLCVENVVIKKYWDIDTHINKDSNVIAELFDIHKNAVEIRTRSDVPIGVLLSGGLDSSCLTAEISELFTKNGNNSAEINTFTTCWEDFEEGDERRYAHLTNDYCGTTENLIYPDETDTFTLYKDMVWHVEGQYGIGALGSYMMLRDIAKYGIKVMINGQGSDETMFGYERYYAWYLKDILRRNGIVAYIRAFIKAANNSRIGKKQLLCYMFYFNNFFVRRSRNIRRIGAVASRYMLDVAKRDLEVRRFTFFDNLADLQYSELRETQLTHILRGDDRMYMAYSMESRVPFIDYRYVEKACMLPEEKKIQAGYTKYPLRKYLEGKLPDEVIWRKNKMGWPSPRKRWIDRFDKSEVERLFENPRSKKFFDLDKVKKLYYKNPYADGVEHFINTELFMRLLDVESI